MGVRLAPEILSKTPDEILIKHMEFSGADLEGAEEIESILEQTVTPTGEVDDLEIDDVTFDGTAVQMEISKGRNHVSYEIHIKVRTSRGQEITGCGIMNVGPCGRRSDGD